MYMGPARAYRQMMPDQGPPLMAVTVDVAVFTERQGRPMVALIQRANEPYRGAWALPGGFVELDEDLADAAIRELAEETGLEVPADRLTQIAAYGTPDRDPRMRVVTVSFWAHVADLPDPMGSSDAAASRLIPLDEATAPGFELAFDHPVILGDAIEAAGL
jgi:8-oxo-dGTP diphosphatase